MNIKKLLIIGGSLVLSLILFFIFIGVERIDAGHVGLKVNMTGGDRGISKTEYVTGWVFYFRGATQVYEFPIYQQHIEYEPFEVPSKGGTIFTVHPSFNYSLNSGEVSNMFQNLRQPLNQLQNGYILNALRIALREATNKFTVDSILNNVSVYDASITDVINEKLHPYFTVSQFTSGLKPDAELAKTISAKAKAIQEAIQLENEQKKIKAQVENDILIASRDSAIKVKAALAEAKAITLKQEALQKSPQYVELIKAERWNGILPQYVLGGGNGLFLNINEKKQ